MIYILNPHKYLLNISMNTNDNHIIWEKWKDPLGFDDNDIIEEKYESDYTEEVQQIKKIKCQIISTPLGLIPFNEITSSSEIFNFWTGHTNFALTKKITEIIEDTPGIETLNVFTKYRFRVGIGKAFSDSLVMREINSNIYHYLKMEDDYVK